MQKKNMHEQLNPIEVKKELEKNIEVAKKILHDAEEKYNHVTWQEPNDSINRYAVDECKRRLMQIDFCHALLMLD